mgnify:CR=1 FL=1
MGEVGTRSVGGKGEFTRSLANLYHHRRCAVFGSAACLQYVLFGGSSQERLGGLGNPPGWVFFFLSFGLVYNVKLNPRGVRMNGERKGGQLVKRDGCIRQEGVLATLEHAGREVAHDRLRLYCEVAQHCIGPPSTKETDGIGVNMCTEECHGAGSS